jgi:hypothetical protein
MGAHRWPGVFHFYSRLVGLAPRSGKISPG